MSYHYSDATRAEDPHALPDVEVFYIDEHGYCDGESYVLPHEPGEPAMGLAEEGFYFTFGFPGCLPDGEPSGPYPSEAEALAAAREQVGRCRHGIDEMEPCARCDVGTLDAPRR